MEELKQKIKTEKEEKNQQKQDFIELQNIVINNFFFKQDSRIRWNRFVFCKQMKIY